MLVVGTDFSGIGAPEVALNNLEIEHRIAFACEIDEPARKSYCAIHKAEQMFEDITTRKHEEIEQLGLYIAGFPCGPFSHAGKRLGFEDIKGTLFFDTAEFIRINRPEVFILENVRGLVTQNKGRTFQTVVDVLSNGGESVNDQFSIDFYEDGLGYHIYHKILNTKEHGLPQNRERVFIVGFKNPKQFSFPNPEPLNLKVKDLLQDQIDDKYFLSEKAINSIVLNPENMQKPKINPDIAATLQSPGNANGTYKGMNVIKIRSGSVKGYEEATQGDIIDFAFPSSKTRRGRVSKDVAGTLDVYCNQAIIGDRFRKLTPLECWRLQGFPDELFHKAAKVNTDTHLYKQAGNSISVAVIQKIINNIYK